MNLTKLMIAIALVLAIGILILTIDIALSLSTMVTVAQEATETANTPEETAVALDDEYIPPEDIAIGLEGFLNEHMSVPALASLVLILTAFTKRYAPSKFTSKNIQFFWVIATYGLYTVAVNQGYTLQLENVSELITKIGNILLGATGTAVASHHFYKLNKNAGIPIVGTSRKQAGG